MAQAIRSEVTMVSPFGQIIIECPEMVKNQNIALFFIRQSANMAAHFIARESRSFPG